MTVKRPLVWISAALVGGAALSSAFAPPFAPLLASFVVSMALAIFFLFFRKLNPAAAATLAAAFLLGACAYQLEAHVREMPDELAVQYASDTSIYAELSGVVSERRSAAGDKKRATFVMDVEHIRAEIDGVSYDRGVSGKTRVNWYNPDARIEPGDLITVSGKLKFLSGFKNPGGFDYERYMHRRGIFTTLYARGPGAAEVGGRSELGPARRFREYFRREGLRIISASTWTGETRAFMAAILLGDRSLLTDDMEEWFKRTGTFHILAISGLHVGLIYLIISLALTPLPLGLRGRVAVSLAIVWVYAFAVGGSVPVTRASIMLTLVLSGHYFSRDGDFLTSVALAALLIVGFDPVVIDEAGFQLSFTAVLLLCTFEPFYSKKVYPLIRDRLGKIPAPLVSRLGITLFASLVVGVGMLPLVAYHFNRVSFVFPIANLFVVPVLSFMLAAGIACLLAGLLWIKAAMLFGLAAEALSWTIFGVVRLCSIIPGGSTYTASPPIHLLGLEALAIALIWWRPLSIRKVAICLTLAALVVGVSLSTEPRQGVLRATFLEVGDADACLIEFPNGDTMLIDTGFATSGLDCGEDIIAPFLWKRGITSIDTLVLTHPDSDHTGGALFLIEAFRIGRLWAPEAAAATPGYDKVFAAMSERGIPVERLAAGSEPARFGEVLIETLNPPPAGAQAGRSDNDLSLALRLTHGETSLLMGGDAESKAARFMTGSGKELQSDVLKASHHGLRSGFNRRFVEMVNPRIVVISGKPHRSGQNIEERIERYSPLCETVFSTSSHGAITIESDGQDISAVFERKAYRNLF